MKTATKTKGKKPKVEIKKSTLTLRLEGNEVQLIEDLKELLNEKQSSTALIRCAKLYLSLVKEHKELKEFSNRMTRQYWDLYNALEDKMKSETRLNKLLEKETGSFTYSSSVHGEDMDDDDFDEENDY
jgi:hypothetical protein